MSPSRGRKHLSASFKNCTTHTHTHARIGTSHVRRIRWSNLKSFQTNPITRQDTWAGRKEGSDVSASPSSILYIVTLSLRGGKGRRAMLPLRCVCRYISTRTRPHTFPCIVFSPFSCPNTRKYSTPSSCIAKLIEEMEERGRSKKENWRIGVRRRICD